MRRLTRQESKRLVASERLRKKVCPLCIKPWTAKREPVLDHCHDTGRIRGLLCRNCNGREGEIKNRAIRCSNKEDYKKWLKNLIAYYDYHDSSPSSLVYHGHKTDEEKRLLKNKRARLKRAKEKKNGR